MIDLSKVGFSETSPADGGGMPRKRIFGGLTISAHCDMDLEVIRREGKFDVEWLAKRVIRKQIHMQAYSEILDDLFIIRRNLFEIGEDMSRQDSMHMIEMITGLISKINAANPDGQEAEKEKKWTGIEYLRRAVDNIPVPENNR